MSEREPRLAEIAAGELIVPIRSSSGEAPDPARVPLDGMRHGSDERGRFLAAFSTEQAFDELGPAGSDRIRLSARDLFERADRAGQRVMIDPGGDRQLEVSTALLPFLAAGIDPNSPEALRARTAAGAGLANLAPPEEVPQAFAGAARAALERLPQVVRAWLLRAGDAWTMGVELAPGADLAAFDEVRNRLHAVAAEQLGSRRQLAVTDLRAASLRDVYDSMAAPFHVRSEPKKGLLSRLFGGDRA